MRQVRAARHAACGARARRRSEMVVTSGHAATRQWGGRCRVKGTRCAVAPPRPQGAAARARLRARRHLSGHRHAHVRTQRRLQQGWLCLLAARRAQFQKPVHARSRAACRGGRAQLRGPGKTRAGTQRSRPHTSAAHKMGALEACPEALPCANPMPARSFNCACGHAAGWEGNCSVEWRPCPAPAGLPTPPFRPPIGPPACSCGA